MTMIKHIIIPFSCCFLVVLQGSAQDVNSTENVSELTISKSLNRLEVEAVAVKVDSDVNNESVINVNKIVLTRKTEYSNVQTIATKANDVGDNSSEIEFTEIRLTRKAEPSVTQATAIKLP